MIFPHDSITISLPLPDKALSPNARVHWAVKAKAVKKHRQWSMMACFAVLSEHVYISMSGPRWKTATVQAIFTFPTKRTPDKDNCSAMLKAYCDGLQDAGVITNDSGLTHEPIVITEPDKANVGVVIRVTKGRDDTDTSNNN